jgi:hypothetical protein
VDAQNFCSGGPHINPRIGWTQAGFCVCGDVEPKTLHQVSYYLMADGAFPLVPLDPPGHDTHVGSCGGRVKSAPQIKMSQ